LEKPMTKERLKQYISLGKEIVELEVDIQTLFTTDKGIVIDTVMDYRSGYGVPQGIRGFNMKEYRQKCKRLQKKKAKAEKELVAIEEFIDGIDDSLTRRVFKMRYEDGMSWTAIALKLGKHDENYPRIAIHDKFLKNF